MTRRRAATGPMVGAALLTSTIAMACGASDSDYFGPNEPTWVRVPVTSRDPAYVGVIVLLARSGDTVTIDSVDFGGPVGDAHIEALVSILHGRTKLIGAIAESRLGAEIELSTYVPATGFQFDEADGAVALAARITGTTSVHGFRNVTVRFHTARGSRSWVDLIPYRASVCSAETFEAALQVCKPIADEMDRTGP
jgi:hypothetical protein